MMWEGGIKQLVESLPSVAIFRPVNNNILDSSPYPIFYLSPSAPMFLSAEFLAPYLEALRTLGAKR